MSPKDKEPLLPKRWDSLYGSEAGSDVIFLVGPEELRLPAHRNTLAEKNEVFSAMLKGPLAGPPSEAIPIVDVDGRAFEHLLRFLYGCEVCLQSVPTALSTLFAADKYDCPDLVKMCIAFVDQHMDVATVLDVYSTVGYFNPYTPTAPPLDDKGAAAAASSASASSLTVPMCDQLVHNCLRYIDQHAAAVLASETVEDLLDHELASILGRDSLVASEQAVFDALCRWANRQLQRRQLGLTDENKRAVLGELVWLPRYPLMTPDEFVAGPMKAGWLEAKDSAAIMASLLGHDDGAKSKMLEEKWTTLTRPRRATDDGVFQLSVRTGLGASEQSVDAEGKRGGRKNKKKKEKKMKKYIGTDREKRSRGAKIGDFCCGVITCIFD